VNAKQIHRWYYNVTLKLFLNSPLWRKFIWWGWEKASTLHPWSMADSSHHGLLFVSGQHPACKLAHCRVQV